MGNSGKTAIGAFAAAAGLLVLTAITLEEAALVAFLAAVAVGYVASVSEAFARRRYLALLAGGAGTSLFIGCSIAFLRMWGLAFNQDAAALGQAVASRDSDIYFYLAAASGVLTLLVLFCAAVWPSRRRLRHAGPAAAARPRSGGPARSAGNARAGRAGTASRSGTGGRQTPASASRAAGAPARPAARLPAGARQSTQQTPGQKAGTRQTPPQRTPPPRVAPPRAAGTKTGTGRAPRR
ncbi:hypothetical protein [Arthrobacter sp. NPDC056727]|uniref:hypothetical protein n=1 Tax=Arthrobacter sp. NPDC056727 TaxID=3345927 RepID=UPI0036718F74